MTRFAFIPALGAAVVLSLSVLFFSIPAHAQNPPMNCAADGIIQVCTLADTTPAPTAVMPPAPAAHVTYTNGQLTVMAENVPLKDVLNEIGKKTGATIEIPNGSATEPIFANIGPGSVRDVLVALLNGTKFNYVMLGSQSASNDLEKIVLTPADQATEADQSVAMSSPLPSAFSSRKTLTVTTTAAQDGASKSAEQRQADRMAEIEARKQKMMPIWRQQYAEMMQKAAEARASEQSSAQPSGSDSPAQPATAASPAQPAGPDSPAQPAGADSQTQQ
ncbi:MAG: hypothetical protein ACRD2U_02665 [Terriglobales bacterium]